MMGITDLKDWPKENADLRQKIYQGAIIRKEETPATKMVVDAVNRELEDVFSDAPSPGLACYHLPADEFFDRVKRVRNRIAEADFRQLQTILLLEAGFEPSENDIDCLRLRAVVPGALVTAGMKTAYDLHRDTWFANPYTQINWWVALHEIDEKQSFAFFPQYFDNPIPNNSAAFDYREFMQKAGWQSTGKVLTGAVYPTVTDDIDIERKTKFTLGKAGVLLFSAAHLHATQLNERPFCRYSLDFRIVHKGDFQKGIGAINVDGKARGNAAEDYMTAGKP